MVWMPTATYENALSHYPIQQYTNQNTPIFKYANIELWQFVRLGLNYLESPKPDRSPESVSPAYMHPDSKGFGAYGFSPQAYADVQRIYQFFKQYSWQDILNSQQLYDLANQAFADWLLSKLQGYIQQGSSYREIFNVLQQAWNLGLSGFKQGRQVVDSRATRAKEFLSSNS